jgi:asparagine synthase (glutamine-hydrolysing)
MLRIVGCVTNLPRAYAEDKVLHMLESLRRDDICVTGMWAEESLGLFIGWARREHPFSYEVPLRSERGDVVLFFSGEEFADVGTEQHLKQRGHDLGDSGPSYLVHLYEEDPSFPSALNGRFHGLVIDRNLKAAFLFNDRYSMHRICYHQAKDGFYFATEAKALLAVCPETRKLDLRAAGEFVSCGCTLGGRTLFEGVHVLPAGSKWLLRNGSLADKQAYFKPEEWENQEPLEPEPYYRELRQVLSRNLPKYFRPPEPIGVSLTGGLDSRILMAWQRCPPGSLPCYTFGDTFRDCQDVSLGRRVAQVCGQPHETIRVGNEFFTRFSDYAERSVLLSDGCVDVSRAPDLYLNERARNIAPVRMSGVYGGEVLRGVKTFKPDEIGRGLFTEEFRRYIQQANETYAEILPGHPVSFAVFKQAPWSQYGVLALEQTQVSLRTPFLDNDLVRTAFRAPSSALASKQICIRLIADGNRALLGIPTDRGLYLNGKHLPQTISHAVLESLFKAEYAYDVGMPGWLARIDHALSSFHFERLFLGRHKVFHFRIWYRDPLASYVREMLLDSMSLSRPYLERTEVESIVRGHLKGNRNYTLEIHKLLTLELVQRLLLQGTDRRPPYESRVPAASCVN